MNYLILILACFRLAQFLPNDVGPFSIFQNIRDWSFNKLQENPNNKFWYNFYEFVTCPYCQGVWIAAILSFALKPESIIEYSIGVFAIAGGQAFLEIIGSGGTR